MMRLTERGVFFRSRVLRLPFGDQAFAFLPPNSKCWVAMTRRRPAAKIFCLFGGLIADALPYYQSVRASGPARGSTRSMAGSGRPYGT